MAIFTVILFFQPPYTRSDTVIRPQIGYSFHGHPSRILTCGTTWTSGTAAQHTADGTGCDEVNSEHVPVDSNAQPVKAESAGERAYGGLLNEARRRLFPGASSMETSVDSCRRVLF
jgi:hypothetical protein